jgi:hypothetical protein
MTTAVAFYQLPPRVLRSIQAVEGERPGLVHMNANETADPGVMQVNAAWVQLSAQYVRMPPRIPA